MNTRKISTALVLAAMLPTSAFADWNGAYGGLSLGTNTRNDITIDTPANANTFETEDSTAIGAFGGYQIQNDDFVFGGELAYSATSDFEASFEGDAVKLDYRTLDLKARVGYVIGDVMAYGTAGVSRITSSDADSGEAATGFNVGIGADYAINDNFVVGAEYLHREVVDEGETRFDPDFEIGVDTLTIRAAYHF